MSAAPASPKEHAPAKPKDGHAAKHDAGHKDGAEKHGGGGHGDGHGGGHGGDGGHGGEHGGGHGGHGHHKKHAEHHPDFGPSAPLWLLSFADTMTNLMCFFILLTAFASKQQGILLEDGLGSIQRGISPIGSLGSMKGAHVPVQFHAGRVVYRPGASINTKTLAEPDGRILDSNRDTMRKVIVDAMAKKGSSTLPAPLIFDQDSTALTSGHASFLDELARGISAASFEVRIDGYAFEEGASPDDGWDISEARAVAVRDYLVRGGVNKKRIRCVAHGMLTLGAATRAGAPPLAQNRWGRRAVVITFLP